MRIWHGAKISAAAISGIERSSTPLSRKTTDGRIDSASARKTLLFRKQTAQTRQYSSTKNAVADQVGRKGHIRAKAEAGMRDVEDHQREAAKAPDLFQHLDRLVVPDVFKSVPLPERKDDIREHDNGHKAQAVRIKPLRWKHSLQSASGQEAPLACRITFRER